VNRSNRELQNNKQQGDGTPFLQRSNVRKEPERTEQCLCNVVLTSACGDLKAAPLGNWGAGGVGPESPIKATAT